MQAEAEAPEMEMSEEVISFGEGATGYVLRLPKRFDGGWKQFELTLDTMNWPIHVSFRPDCNCIVLNEMVETRWEVETAIDFIFDNEAEQSFHLIHDQATYYFFSGNTLLAKRPSVWADSDILIPRGTLSFIELTAAELRAFPEAADTVEYTCPKILKSHGASIRLGGALPGLGAAVEAGLEYIDKQVIPFLSTNTFDRKAVFAVSTINGSCLAAPFVAKFITGNQVYAVYATAEERDILNQIAQLNGLDNLIAIDADHVADALGLEDAPPAQVVLIGDRLFAPENRLIDRIRDLGLSHAICTLSEDVVPGNQIFGPNGTEYNPSICVTVRDSDFMLTHHSFTRDDEFRHGLDIVVAMYNTLGYIIECVDSLLVPGRDDIKIIVVDDGSTDGCGDLVRATYADNPNVSVIRKANGGCASARNYGLMHSNASHITFIDADDLVDAGYYGKLYDLALYTGSEMVQAGFEFYEVDAEGVAHTRPSYEVGMFAKKPRETFNGNEIITLSGNELLAGQPSIWRRVYRRDVLRSKRLTFVENIRAYDDYLFHLETVHYAGTIHMITDLNYKYRQHPAQDIKQGDERHFYEIYMFRLLLKRAVEESWPNFTPFMNSVIGTINWSVKSVRDDLVAPFLKASAEFCVSAEKVFGPGIFGDAGASRIVHPDFAFYYNGYRQSVRSIDGGPMWAYISGTGHHPDILKRLRASRL